MRMLQWPLGAMFFLAPFECYGSMAVPGSSTSRLVERAKIGEGRDTDSPQKPVDRSAVGEPFPRGEDQDTRVLPALCGCPRFGYCTGNKPAVLQGRAWDCVLNGPLTARIVTNASVPTAILTRARAGYNSTFFRGGRHRRCWVREPRVHTLRFFLLSDLWIRIFRLH